jgi:hypothetical protein
MEKVLDPIDIDLLESEMKPYFVRNTNKGNNQIYILNHHNAPNVMQEIGRLREISFRQGGGGTGKPVDIDTYDTDETNYYEQLIVYSPEDREIVGGYRFIDCKKAISEDRRSVRLSTADYFYVSPVCIRNFLPRTIELGRSWVQPNFQPSVNPRKGLFALDNIWDGLGAIVVDNPHIEFFFGKVTMYKSYNSVARDIILYFLKTYFPDYENLIHPIHPLGTDLDNPKLKKLFVGLEFEDAYKVLNQEVRNMGENIPPLVNSYMNLSPTMKTFGTAENPHFGNVEETAIMITIKDIYEHKKKRHIDSYLNEIGH